MPFTDCDGSKGSRKNRQPASFSIGFEPCGQTRTSVRKHWLTGCSPIWEFCSRKAAILSELPRIVGIDDREVYHVRPFLLYPQRTRSTGYPYRLPSSATSIGPRPCHLA